MPCDRRHPCVGTATDLADTRHYGGWCARHTAPGREARARASASGVAQSPARAPFRRVGTNAAGRSLTGRRTPVTRTLTPGCESAPPARPDEPYQRAAGRTTTFRGSSFPLTLAGGRGQSPHGRPNRVATLA